jgi:hypothetical protein
MGTSADKFEYLLETKAQIKEAIREQGVDVKDTDTFRSYATKVLQISGSGSPAEDLSAELAEQDTIITELEEVANSLPDAGGVKPEGTMLIKQNGIYDVTDIAEVDVQVETQLAPTPDPPVLGMTTFNENGEYNAEDYGVDGWSFIKVNVAGSGGERDPNETMYEMQKIDFLLKQAGVVSFSEIPTPDEYLEQQPIVNNLIEKITGVSFNA